MLHIFNNPKLGHTVGKNVCSRLVLGKCVATLRDAFFVRLFMGRIFYSRGIEMKKLLTILSFSVLLVLFIFGLGSCDDEKDLQANNISFKTLTVEGDTVYGKVSNETTEFSFLEEISCNDSTQYVVSLDSYGVHTVVTKTVPLIEGDNLFYVIETNEDNITTYTVTIRRRPMYIVTFDTHGHAVIPSQKIEEDFFVIQPNEIKPKMGYIFTGWNYDFSEPIIKNEIISAKIDLKEEMRHFEFTSTENTCCITGVKDKNITSIVVPDYVTSISDYAFNGCGNLMKMTLPFVGASKTATGYESVFGFIFGFHRSRYSDTIDGLTYQYYDSSSDSAYRYYHYNIPASLRSVTITGGEIGDSVFYGCNNLTNINIPNNISSIGDLAFFGCSSLENITIPNQTTSIGDSAFSRCSSLTSIKMPENVNLIGSFAFSNCNHLVNIVIPEKVSCVKSGTFLGCGELETIILPDRLISIDSNAFKDCTSLTNITLPDQLTSIGFSSFSGCSSLSKINIPCLVTSIGTDAFYNCLELVEIDYDAIESVDLTHRNGVFSSAGQNGMGIKVIIGANVKRIPAYLFQPDIYDNDCSPQIKELLFEKGSKCEIIGESAFADCSSLKTIVIPDSITSIESGAFCGCNELTSVVISKNVKIIENQAFYWCDNLMKVYYYGTASEWLKINIGSGNSDLIYSKRYYYSLVEPALNSSGTSYVDNYWYYDGNGTIIEWEYTSSKKQ